MEELSRRRADTCSGVFPHPTGADAAKMNIVMGLLALLLRTRVSRVGFTLAMIWLVSNLPFWRHVFIASSAMIFATLLLPDEMIFFLYHPLLALAILFSAGFVGANLGRSWIRSLAAWVVVAVLVVALYRAIHADPATSSWLWSKVGVV
jgi:hypothetical protein